MVRAFLVLTLATCAVHAQASQISGPGKAIDSTIIEINTQRIMLFGIDSVMRKQICTLDGKPWQCWTAAVDALQSLLDAGSSTCDVVGEPDIYGRVLGRCTVNGQNVNEQLVERGFAVARPSDTTDYVAAEAAAKEKKVGLWRGQFAQPSAFRRASGVRVDRP
jgi:endonuclease YncB( thermonuclease family)